MYLGKCKMLGFSMCPSGVSVVCRLISYTRLSEVNLGCLADDTRLRSCGIAPAGVHRKAVI
jgi:hypothetical protein